MTETPLIKHEVLFVTNYHKLFMNSDYVRNIREIGEISGFWLIHDNLWLRLTQSFCHELPRISLVYVKC